jgi:hypothetical protein
MRYRLNGFMCWPFREVGDIQHRLDREAGGTIQALLYSRQVKAIQRSVNRSPLKSMRDLLAGPRERAIETNSLEVRTADYGSFQSAWRTLEGIETVNMIRKGRLRWVTKDDVSAQARFVAKLFGIAA